jgi:hypothetical protein
MPTFRTAEDLEKRYAVAASCLLAYAERGNLSMRRVGSLLQFDERAVARLFPRRAADGGGQSKASAGEQRLGYTTLGAGQLGVTAGRSR